MLAVPDTGLRVHQRSLQQIQTASHLSRSDDRYFLNTLRPSTAGSCRFLLLQPLWRESGQTVVILHRQAALHCATALGTARFGYEAAVRERKPACLAVGSVCCSAGLCVSEDEGGSQNDHPKLACRTLNSSRAVLQRVTAVLGSNWRASKRLSG